MVDQTENLRLLFAVFNTNALYYEFKEDIAVPADSHD